MSIATENKQRIREELRQLNRTLAAVATDWEAPMRVKSGTKPGQEYFTAEDVQGYISRINDLPSLVEHVPPQAVSHPGRLFEGLDILPNSPEFKNSEGTTLEVKVERLGLTLTLLGGAGLAWIMYAMAR